MCVYTLFQNEAFQLESEVENSSEYVQAVQRGRTFCSVSTRQNSASGGNSGPVRNTDNKAVCTIDIKTENWS